jgi:predicted PurR-regulated permease PerM
MTESSINPPGEGNGIAGASTNGLPRPSLFRVIVALAAVVVVLVGLRVGAPIINPILFAVVLALLFNPLYSWLKHRGLPTPLALLFMLVFVGAIFAGLFFTLGASIGRFTERLGFYASQLDGRLDDLDAIIEQLGLSGFDLQEVVKPGALADALGVVLSGIAGFLSDLFLILAIMLFLLAEGQAMMDRLRGSVPEDNPRVARLAVFGQNVVRQFGLRAIVNLVTGAGVTVLLLVLGVDFPLLWGILTFFLSFVPYVGLVLAVAPAVVLALAEFGLSRAVLAIAGVVVINVVAENVLSPMMMGRGLNLSPTVVFLSFILWAWVLGGPGAFLAVPITMFVIGMLETFPETRWLARLMGATSAPASPASGAGPPGGEADRTT